MCDTLICYITGKQAGIVDQGVNSDTLIDVIMYPEM